MSKDPNEAVPVSVREFVDTSEETVTVRGKTMKSKDVGKPEKKKDAKA